MKCMWSSATRQQNPPSVLSSVLLDNGERTMYHSSDATLNSVRNAAHDVNEVRSDAAELSIFTEDVAQ